MQSPKQRKKEQKARLNRAAESSDGLELTEKQPKLKSKSRMARAMSMDDDDEEEDGAAAFTETNDAAREAEEAEAA